MVHNLLTRHHLLVGAVGCLVCGGVMVAMWLAALASEGVRPIAPWSGDAGFVVIGIGMLLLGLRHFVHDPEPETQRELEEPDPGGDAS